MSKPTVPDLKELFKQASEIAKQVPENMQEAAFNRAIDLLTNGFGYAAAVGGGSNQNSAGSQLQQPQRKTLTGPKDPKSSVDGLIASINSTEHPGIRSATKVLDRSLMVMQIALADHGVDGLTPADISRILTDKFRIATSRAAVSMALGSATGLVDRVPEGQGFLYRIMEPGQTYLANLTQPEMVNKVAPAIKKRSSSTRRTKATQPSDGADPTPTSARKESKTPATKPQSRAAGKGLSPKSAILGLIGDGFFNEARTAPRVQTQLRTRKGYNIGAAPLSVAMLRLVRDASLEREENADGQYEYRQPIL
jgi:hypothetical protein